MVIRRRGRIEENIVAQKSGVGEGFTFSLNFGFTETLCTPEKPLHMPQQFYCYRNVSLSTSSLYIGKCEQSAACSRVE